LGTLLGKGEDDMVTRQGLETYLGNLLEVGRWSDYGPNGLQVEGRPKIRRLVTGVTASRALIEAAIQTGADALLVHHGLFWRGQDGRVVGWMKQRLAALLAHDINLYGYHLPLDAHPEFGNNAGLGRLLGLVPDGGRFGDRDLGWLGRPVDGEISVEALAARVEQQLGRTPVLLRGDGRPIRRVGWCTGGAQGTFEAAITAGADAYLTGELSEPQAHLAIETGVAFLACGHHATEREGARLLGLHLAQQFELDVTFIDLPNPA
jgi:dinuclear metal center YbgI/SA1388 family protein